jgi:ABC-type transport system involved in multi-copper enzyme maturation permease subunit
MIRFTWLQFRLQVIIAVAAVGIVAVFLAATGPHLAHLYHSNVANCAAQNDCDSATQGFLLNDQFLQSMLSPLVLLIPALIGIFWGAPLVAREVEAGTFRLVWTQSVSRRRWLLVKLGFMGLASMAVAGLFSLMVTWWSTPFDTINQNRFTPLMFSVRGLAPIGYAAFAFALGMTIGVLIPRMLPAMALTLVIFIGVRLIVMLWVRPYFVAPLHTTVPDTQIGGGPTQKLTPGKNQVLPGDWVISDQTINAAGEVIGQNGLIGSGGMRVGIGANGVLIGNLSCPNLTLQGSALAKSGVGPDPAAQALVKQCVTQLGLQEKLTYQPAGRFWSFQGYETALFLALALLLSGSSFWLVRHRA